MAIATPEKFNLVSPAFKADPFPFYARLREESPVHHIHIPHHPRTMWLVTRYDDVAAILKDDRFVKDHRAVMTPEQLKLDPPIPAIFRPLDQNMLDQDDPDHARLRALIHKAFTPRLIEQMRERIEGIADNLLDAVERKGQMDLITDYALPLPLTVISQILGIPPQDQRKFSNWSKVFMKLAGDQRIWTVLRITPPLIMFMRYLRRMFDERRRNPQDDLITALVQAEEGGDRLSEDELLAMVTILIIAGHETTVNLIGSGMLALLQHPDQLEQLRSTPGLIKTGVEELLRYVNPVEQATERYTSQDITVCDVTIPKGELVLAVIASANRDPAQFPNPDTLDLTREPNRHLAFGQGIHYCVGAPLARMEGHIAINKLLERMPNLKLATAPENLQWRSTIVLRGLEALPVRF